MSDDIRPGVAVIMGGKHGIVTEVNGSGMVGVIWLGAPYPVRENPAELTPISRGAEWVYEAEYHQDHGGADIYHHVVCGGRHIAEVETEADARLIVQAVNAYGT